jgi:hypothetical protein
MGIEEIDPIIGDKQLPPEAYKNVNREEELKRKKKLLKQLQNDPNQDFESMRILAREIDTLEGEICKDNNSI